MEDEKWVKISYKLNSYLDPEDYIRILKYAEDETKEAWIQSFQDSYPEEFTLWKMGK